MANRDITNFLSKKGLTHLAELIKNWAAPKVHTHTISDITNADELASPIVETASGEVITRELDNGRGSISSMKVYGSTRQNLWVNPSGTRNGVTVTSNDDGSFTLSGTSTAPSYTYFNTTTHALRPGGTYTISADRANDDSKAMCYVSVRSGTSEIGQIRSNDGTTATGTVSEDADSCVLVVAVAAGATVSGTYRVMLNEGDTAEPWCPPGINGVDELSIVTAGKNLFAASQEAFQVQGENRSNQVFSIGGKAAGIPIGTQLVLSFDYRLSSGAGTATVQQNYSPYLSLGVSYTTLSGDNEWHKVVGNVITVNEDIRAVNLYSFRLDNVSGLLDVKNLQLEFGSTATPYEPPNVTTTPVDLDGHVLNSLPDGTRDELKIDESGNVTLVQRVGVATAPTEASEWTWSTDVTGGRASFNLPSEGPTPKPNETSFLLCDKLPVRKTNGDASYALVSNWLAYAKNPAITSAATAATVVGGATYLYPLATPQEIDLPGVSMPSVKAGNLTVFAATPVPTTIEATTIDLPIVPISSGGTGADNATDARTNLGVYSKAEIDSKLDNIEIDEVIPISKGGTGKTTAKAAVNALMSDINTEGSGIDDSTMFLGVYKEATDVNGGIYKRTFITFWYYIASKIRSTFGFSSSNVLPIEHGGTGATTAITARQALGITPANIGAAASSHTHNYAGSSSAGGTANIANELVSHKLKNEDLNDCQDDAAFYYAGGGNTVLNKPDGVAHFGMFVMRSAEGYKTQVLYGSNLVIYTRQWQSNSWTDWVSYYSSSNKPTPSDIGAAASSHNHSASNITSGTLPISRGGTGLTSSPSMLVNLASTAADTVLEASPRPGITGTLPISHGGTGATTLEDAKEALGIKPSIAGIIYPYAGEIPPVGYLMCDGQAVSRSQYSALFAVIGTTYGEGDGTSTFNLPDLQQKVPVGADGVDYELGGTGGEAKHTLTVAEMPSHSHPLHISGGSGWNSAVTWNGSQAGQDITQHVGYTGGNQPHNNMQPYTVLNYIISTGETSNDATEGVVSYPLAVSYGGTGASTKAGALQNLGITISEDEAPATGTPGTIHIQILSGEE